MSASQTTTTVVTKQVTSGGGTTVLTTGNRDWSTGVLSCFDNCGHVICGICCLPCFAGKQSSRMGEHCCVPIMVPGGPIAMRTKLRLILGIRGSICGDCLCFSCCAPCMICQMARELDQAGW